MGNEKVRILNMTFRPVSMTDYGWNRAMQKLIFVVSAASLWAVPQQLTITSGNKLTVTVRATAPYSTLSTFRIEWRQTIPASAAATWSGLSQKAWSTNLQGPGYVASLYTSGTGFTYQINDFQDSGGSGAQFSCPILAFGQDNVVRVQKWPTNMTCETWNVDGSNYQKTFSTSFLNVPGLTGSLQMGDATDNQGTLAFFRAFSGNIALNSKPPFGGTGGDLWEYEFNGNLNDSSGHGLTLARTGSLTFSAAATYPPACLLPPQQTFRAGTTLTSFTGAHSFPLDGNDTLTYSWQQIPSSLSSMTGLSMPSVLQFSSQTDINPTVQGTIAGTYTMQLTVTDSNGQHTTCSEKYGMVATDANGSVIISNPVHAQILGPMIASYASPWAAEPAQHIAYGQLMIQKLAGTSPLPFQFVDYWNQAQAGTVMVANGSQAVIGTGTTFTTTFCQGPGNPNVPKGGGTSIVIWYPILSAYGLPAGTTGRRMGQVISCIDDTHLTAHFTSNGTFNWVTDTYIGAGSGLSYAYVEQGGTGAYGIGGWQVGNYPGNYYDNVKALYALWYRTGIDDYLVAARTLADRWWTYPGIDKGIPYETSAAGGVWGSVSLPSRSLSLMGLFMRNADNPPYSYDAGLRTMVDEFIGLGTPNGSTTITCPVGPTVNCPVNDVREQSYQLAGTALYAMFGTDIHSQPNALAAVSRDMTHRWGLCQTGPDGFCGNNEDLGVFYASWNTGGANFTASVTNGSNIVTANGGTWDLSKFGSCSPTPCTSANPPNAIWITSTGTIFPTSNTQGDGGWYYVVYHSPTQLYLTDITGQSNVPYTGATNASAGWETLTSEQANNAGWLGIFWQPYQTGILNQAYAFVASALASSDPANAANAASWAVDNANVLATLGFNSTSQSGFVTNGPYYAISPTCPSGGVSYLVGGCDSGLLGDRELNSETLNTATIAYRFNPTSAKSLSLGDTMMAAMFAQAGEPGFDGMNILGDLVNPGFLYTANSQHKWLGAFWGVGADWSWASVRLGGLRPPNPRVVQVSLNYQTASQAVLTVVSPDGTSSQVTCTSTPCPVTIDARQGDHLLSIKYLNPTNQVLLPAEQTILKAR